MTNFSADQIAQAGQVLNNGDAPLTDRFRALFTLKNIGGNESIDWIVKAFSDPSALLKHEVAYCLGQLQSEYAVPSLVQVVSESSREPIVRHEAAEALGAIGGSVAKETLMKFQDDPVKEVSETCQLALERIRFLETSAAGGVENPYGSVDPAPPSKEEDTEKLRKILLDENLPLFERYRAMFSLRNKADKLSIDALCEGLDCSSALFRHEIAFVLGQAASPYAVTALKLRLEDPSENAMVRHECAEALGGISSPGLDVEAELGKYLGKEEAPVLRESCVVALDMAEYKNSDEFQYANALSS